ncbi:uncharacterized protein L969DRAFT_44161 [Mixia osmundae IAM 14324]|uniref:Uncharacterized protein n=1 Tax=Mixia osmundae (strain CBS 9802 / IAM 14324 / JCM 22182 / KY 12970) TaxID=764103 RepID=G7E0A8_MIXOS|nr:uncharacterized protein L969DRAFT_44161 [Mixia osmundae IAM 14324]KEI42259.1 hypothetical protein L969DRAFT_44161 [Mixia osmundae IAM 14324]GAA96268.1 hypothetical protein E5Q_02933 [Mixia osmundae IAM 14324]
MDSSLRLRRPPETTSGSSAPPEKQLGQTPSKAEAALATAYRQHVRPVIRADPTMASAFDPTEDPELYALWCK